MVIKRITVSHYFNPFPADIFTLYPLKASGSKFFQMFDIFLLLPCFTYGLAFQVISKKPLCSKYFTRNSKRFLYENDRKSNFYKFSCKFASTPILSFRRNKKQEINFQHVGDLVEKYFCFLFIESRALVQRYAEINRLL